MHKDHDHAAQNGNPASGGSSVGRESAMRTTSTFTTAADEPGEPRTPAYQASQQAPASSEGAGWGGFGGTQSNDFAGEAPPGEDGFGSSNGNGGNRPPGYTRPSAAGKRTGTALEEEVSVNSLEEKEGMFLFQHRNYEVVSTRRNSKVIRRYSDFVWLMECLHKRYPFRQLPLLPPKRVASKSNRGFSCLRPSLMVWRS